MLLIILLVVGALLPIAVAAATIYLGTPRTPRANWSSARALAKGLILGIVGGLAVSAVVLAGVLGVEWLLE